MGLLTMLAATLLVDDSMKVTKDSERERRIQAARERDEDKLRRKIRILKEEFGELETEYQISNITDKIIILQYIKMRLNRIVNGLKNRKEN